MVTIFVFQPQSRICSVTESAVVKWKQKKCQNKKKKKKKKEKMETSLPGRQKVNNFHKLPSWQYQCISRGGGGGGGGLYNPSYKLTMKKKSYINRYINVFLF